ncbi:protein TadG [Vibrio astriarenae]|nr:protein TadG [Vibrio sp. C7]
MGAAGRARKYQSHAIDVVLAADFSGSMRNNWNGSVRYLGLIDVVNSVADELAHFNQLFDPGVGVNTIGISPYDHYNRVVIGSDKIENPFDATLHCDTTMVKGSHQANSHSPSTTSKMLRIPGTDNTGNKAADVYDEDRIVLGRVDNLVYSGTNLQYGKTLDQMKAGGVDVSTEYCNRDNTELARFYDIPLTSDFESFKSQLNTFRPDHASGRGYTASFQGFLGGTRLLKRGINSRKLLILLSDGQDTGSYSSIGNGSNTPNTGFKTIATNLTNSHKMCDEIRSYLSTYTAADGSTQQAQVELAVIGFTYNPSDHPALETCVGKDNVFKAENKEEILAQILSLIAEEIGRLK